MPDGANAAPAAAEQASAAPGWLRAGAWQLHHESGLPIVDGLLFIGDGVVWRGDAPVWFWHADAQALHIQALDGTPFLDFRIERGGRRDAVPVLRGRRHDAATPDLVLSPMADPVPLGRDRTLNASVALGAGGPTLLVTFNSIARGFDGRDYGPAWRWEFHDLPGRLGVDHVRVVERVDPPHWYLDNTARLRALLGGVIAQGYRQVVCCGLSSGGYGSMLIAELLAPAYPAVQFRTAVINPQTGHAPVHRRVIAGMPSGIAPATLTDAAYQARDVEETEIARLARAGGARDNIEHVLFYDDANPAERYYVDLVRGLPGFRQRPFSFGVGHMSGCTALYERRVAHAQVEAFCRAFQPG